MSELLTFTEYYIFIPDFFIDAIQADINKRDLSALTGGRVKAIRVTGMHPFVELTGAILSSTTSGVTPDLAATLPAISVVQNPASEAHTMMGQGLKPRSMITQDIVDNIRQTHPGMESRIQEGLITDSQLLAIENKIIETGGGLLVDVHGFYEKTSVMVSLWGSTLQETTVIGNLLRSVIYQMRKNMLSRKLKDIKIRIDHSLSNFNFGRILFGMEAEIEFTSYFVNVTVTDEKPIDGNNPVYSIGSYLAEGRFDDDPIGSYGIE